MKRFLIPTTLAVLGLFILDGQTASARDYTWTGANTGGGCAAATDWNCGKNWVFNDNGGVPGVAVYPGTAANDTALVARDISIAGGRVAVIPQPTLIGALANPLDSVTIRNQMSVTTAGFGMTITNPAASGAGLEIAGGGVLDVNNAAGSLVLGRAGKHLIDGELRLSVDGATLQIAATLDLGGSGTIIGLHNGAVIQITDPGDGNTRTLTLRPDLKIEGALEIQGAAGDGTKKFVNDGLVWANSVIVGQRTLAFANVTVEGQGEYRVGPTDTDVMHFTDTAVATRLNADFSILDLGILDIDNGLTTAGHMYIVGDGGAIQCAGGQCIFAGR